ncbi:unnamed protein product [Amoebophrya sp. A25]|nr:unnamed protein product [Amoebophrya sp. A25]|eukprot:GSA25T00008724001.1
MLPFRSPLVSWAFACTLTSTDVALSRRLLMAPEEHSWTPDDVEGDFFEDKNAYQVASSSSNITAAVRPEAPPLISTDDTTEVEPADSDSLQNAPASIEDDPNRGSSIAAASSSGAAASSSGGGGAAASSRSAGGGGPGPPSSSSSQPVPLLFADDKQPKVMFSTGRVVVAGSSTSSEDSRSPLEDSTDRGSGVVGQRPPKPGPKGARRSASFIATHDTQVHHVNYRNPDSFSLRKRINRLRAARKAKEHQTKKKNHARSSSSSGNAPAANGRSSASSTGAGTTTLGRSVQEGLGALDVNVEMDDGLEDIDLEAGDEDPETRSAGVPDVVTYAAGDSASGNFPGSSTDLATPYPATQSDGPAAQLSMVRESWAGGGEVRVLPKRCATAPSWAWEPWGCFLYYCLPGTLPLDTPVRHVPGETELDAVCDSPLWIELIKAFNCGNLFFASLIFICLFLFSDTFQARILDLF